VTPKTEQKPLTYESQMQDKEFRESYIGTHPAFVVSEVLAEGMNEENIDTQKLSEISDIPERTIKKILRDADYDISINTTTKLLGALGYEVILKKNDREHKAAWENKGNIQF
jgi:plasmid maintenance system antidote protein VapI